MIEELRRWVIKDSDGKVLNTFVGEADPTWVGRDFLQTLVHSVEQTTPAVSRIQEVHFSVGRRVERDREFAMTIDRYNPFRYNQLTTEELTEIEAWRQAWLDYPSDEVMTTPIRPLCLT